METIALVVNCYERTYRKVLSPGYFPAITASNRRDFHEVIALINNVNDRSDATNRARLLQLRGEINSFRFVSDELPAALRHSGLPRSALKRRPFLLDYGLVMPHVINSEWLLGWDAETVLERPYDWIGPSMELMHSRRDVFHASLNWHPLNPGDSGLEAETIETSGDFSLNYGFSDQLFLVRRADLLKLRWRTLAPAAIVRHAPHPYTFEYRVESYQRARKQMRATLRTLRYKSFVVPGGVVQRTSPSLGDRLQLRFLRSAEHHIINRIPRSAGPRFSK